MPGYEWIGEEEKQAVIDIFDNQNGVLFAHGFESLRNGRYRVREFENQFADYIGTNYAVAVSSGTAAIKLGLQSLGITEGDEVITQGFTFIATAEAILDVGAQPIFANSDKTLNLDPNEIINLETNNTKAILPVHMLGGAADNHGISRELTNKNIPVIDENCESLGARVDKFYIGSQNRLGIFSLDFGKTITCGEGGIITTNDENLFQSIKELRDHGHKNDPNRPRGKDLRSQKGFNYRMTEIQAAIATEQLKKLPRILLESEKRFRIFEKFFKSKSEIELRHNPINSVPNFDTIIFYLESSSLASKFVEEMSILKLTTKNIPDACEWHFAYHWEHLRGHIKKNFEEIKSDLKYTKDLLDRSIAIPIYSRESLEDLDDRINKLNIIFQKFGIR
jgi:8-amino-3,8-dideoxy-alpha-D-manno-octulosonate transaminase